MSQYFNGRVRSRAGQIRRAVVAMEFQRRAWGYSFKLECGHWIDMTIYSTHRGLNRKTMRCQQCEAERDKSKNPS